MARPPSSVCSTSSGCGSACRWSRRDRRREAVTASFEERVAHNESVMRDINERIDAGTWPGPDTELLTFCCECALLGCNLLVELTRAEYAFVRENPRRF